MSTPADSYEAFQKWYEADAKNLGVEEADALSGWKAALKWRASAGEVAPADSGIKPCPFCGSQAYAGFFGLDQARVKCLNSLCEAQVSDHSKSGAAERWNARAGEVAQRPPTATAWYRPVATEADRLIVSDFAAHLDAEKGEKDRAQALFRLLADAAVLGKQSADDPTERSDQAVQRPPTNPDLHLKVRGVALWIKTLQGQAQTVVDSAFETLLLAADALAAGRQSPEAPASRREKWYVGSMNDGCFIIDKPPRPSHDYPVHDADVQCITGFPANDDATFAAAQRICDAHNHGMKLQSADEINGETDRQDALRYRWAKPLLSGDDEPIANARTAALAIGLVAGKPVNEIIDAALAQGAPPDSVDLAGSLPVSGKTPGGGE